MIPFKNINYSDEDVEICISIKSKSPNKGASLLLRQQAHLKDDLKVVFNLMKAEIKRGDCNCSGG